VLLFGCDVELLYEVILVEIIELFVGVVVLLNLIFWFELFGMVMIEVLVSGIFVLMFVCGVVLEIVDYGCMGFLCVDEDVMVDVVC